MNMIKLYYKIAIAHKVSLLLYIGIFVICFFLFALTSSTSGEVKVYEGVKPRISMIDHDKSELSALLTSYLKDKTEIVELGQDKQTLEDALFYVEISAIVEIPKGFEESFTSSNVMDIDVVKRPDNIDTVMIKQQVNSYLNTMATYKKIQPNHSYQDLNAKVMASFSHKTKMELIQKDNSGSSLLLRGNYFNYLTYIAMVCCLMVVGQTMHSIYRSEILKRNNVSPLTTSNMNLQLVLANASFGLVLWIILMTIVFLFTPTTMMTTTGLLYMAASLVFVMMSICMGFMITALLSKLVYANDALNGIVNVVGLGSAFLGGAFIPQDMIGENVLIFSRFLPSYWFVKLSDLMKFNTEITADIMEAAVQCIGILLLFGAAFLLIGFVIMKNRRSQTEITDTSATVSHE